MQHHMGKIRKSMVLLIMTAVCGGISHFEGRILRSGNDQLARNSQTRVRQDLSGIYVGRVTVSDASRDTYLITGPATLEIKENRFTLTQNTTKKNQTPKTLTGKIDTFWLPEQNRYAGELQLDSESNPIEIRWYRKGNVLKIIRAVGANRVLRFCKGISRTQCRKEAEDL